MKWLYLVLLIYMLILVPAGRGLTFNVPVTVDVNPHIAITLNGGWNLISIPLLLDDSDIEVVLGSIMDKVEVVNSFNGAASTYDPGLPEFSDLKEIDYKNGYWVKIRGGTGVELVVSGLEPEDKTINLNKGWNLISYMCNEAKNVEDVFGDIMDNVMVIYGYNGGASTYDPEFPGFSDLQKLEPGLGYWVLMNEPAVLDYSGICA